jgi:hypothetical protein
MKYSGQNWAVFPSPLPPAGGGFLFSVTCPSATDCWAVGDATDPPTDATQSALIEQYQGTGWTIVPTTYVSDGPVTELRSVACASVDACVAIGYSGGAGTAVQLVETDTGDGWSSVSVAGLPTELLTTAVTCVGETGCWVVGDGLIAAYSNGVWSTVPVLDEQQQLQDVTCTDSGDCWAVGFVDVNADAPFLEQFTPQ